MPQKLKMRNVSFFFKSSLIKLHLWKHFSQVHSLLEDMKYFPWSIEQKGEFLRQGGIKAIHYFLNLNLLRSWVLWHSNIWWMTVRSKCMNLLLRQLVTENTQCYFWSLVHQGNFSELTGWVSITENTNPTSTKFNFINGIINRRDVKNFFQVLGW